MPGEINATGAPPRYKGAASAQQSVEHRYTRGKGWTSIKRDRGTIDQLKGQMSALTAYANEIVIIDSGMYSELTATWTGIEPGTADVDVVPIWELHQNVIDLDALFSDSANEIEFEFPGAIQAIRFAIIEFKKKSDLNGVTLPYRSTTISNKVIDPAFQAQAYALFDTIIAGTDHFRFYQPVLSRTIVVQTVNETYKEESPKIYESTTILKAHLDIPATIQAAIPDVGQWLETPPLVQQTAQGKFQIHQTWEWEEEIEDLFYRNRVTS